MSCKASRIFLIGLPGSGKTTTGQQLAKALGWGFIDTDALIEAQHGPISTIFKSKGEAYFRKLEQELVQVGFPEQLVIATGGGLPYYNNVLTYLKEQGTVVFLHIPEDQIVQRMEANRGDRPLLAGEEPISHRIQRLSSQRVPVYLQANLVVTTNSLQPILQAVC